MPLRGVTALFRWVVSMKLWREVVAGVFCLLPAAIVLNVIVRPLVRLGSWISGRDYSI